MIPLQVFTLQKADKTIFHGDFFPATRQMKFTKCESKTLNFPRYRDICLKAPSKCVSNAINALQAQPRYRQTFSVYRDSACHEYLVYNDWPHLRFLGVLTWVRVGCRTVKHRVLFTRAITVYRTLRYNVTCLCANAM